MRPISSQLGLIILLALSILTSCKEEDILVKKADGNGTVSYFAKASGSGVKKTDTKSITPLGSVAVEWSAATIYVEKIAFEGKTSHLLDTTIFVEKNINLFNADALTGVIQLPAGAYKDVKVKLFARKSDKSEMAFNLRGTFINTKGGRDSVVVGSSYPFEANLQVPDITIDSSDKYRVTFNFNLDKVLSDISTELLQTARSYAGKDNSLMYVIWKGGSDEEPFYDQVIANWQTVASVEVSKQ